ncbi:MAG: choice-of-anchor D domain-containing protein [Verrucomicrobiota bacterium]
MNPPIIFSLSRRCVRSGLRSALASIAILTCALQAAEIVVEQPSGTGLTDNAATTTFTSVIAGSTGIAKTYTITNLGSSLGNLAGIDVVLTGGGATNFTLDKTGLATSLIPGASTTFTVAFSPLSTGAKTCGIEIVSNDADENPFNILLSGTGAATTVTLSSTGSTQNVTIPDGVGSFTVEAWGGGGSGSGSSSGHGGGGGGGGAYARSVINGPLLSSYPLFVGAAGQDSTFNTNVVVAKAGSAATATSFGAGGSATTSVGDTKRKGGNGGYEGTFNPASGGGGSASTSADGNVGQNTVSNSISGAGGAGWGAGSPAEGQGGNGGANNSIGTVGTIPGGGGGGGGKGTANGPGGGAAGAAGRVVLTFVASFPEIDVEGNGQSIVDGDVTADLADHTDFGNVLVGDSITRTYTIDNLGTAPLTLGTVGVTGSGFSVSSQPVPPVAPGGSTTFQVIFTPTAPGVSSGTVSFSHNDTDENPYNFAIQGNGTVIPIIVSNPLSNTGTAGQSFSQTFTQTNAVGTANFTTASTLPNGLTLSTAGVLGGIPLQTGTFPIVVSCTDSNSTVGTGTTYNLTIDCQTITLGVPANSNGTVGMIFSETFTETGAIGSAAFTTASTLPSGMNLSASGVLSGIPTQTGAFPIVATVTDANGCTGTSSTFNLVVSCQTITIMYPVNAAGTVNAAFNETFTQLGAQGTATFTTASTLPSGLGLSSAGVLDGTPTQDGTFPIVVTVTDMNGCTGTSSTYNLVIAPVSPEIAVYDGNGTGGSERTDNSGTHDFGSVNTGSSSAAQTFTIQNTGLASLTGLAVSSTNATEFTFTQPMTESLAPGSTTTFTMAFSPSAAGARSGVINIASNDSDENPFEINVSGTGTGETPIYDNGPLVTHSGTGAGGADESRLQTTSLGMSTIGFGGQTTANNRVADDFTIPTGETWTITGLEVFSYQTGSTTTSTYNGLHFRIWNGAPNAGGTIVFGDTTTNRLTNSKFSNTYRVTETTVGDSARPIMTLRGGVGSLVLGPGTYWVDWSASGTLASGPWFPAITINGQRNTGNAIQFIGQTLTWGNALDGGTQTPPQGMPFKLYGSISGAPSPEIAVYDGSGIAGAERTDNTGTHGFGNVNTGSSSSAQTFTIENKGSANLTLGTVTLTGTDPGQFSVTQPASATLAANATTTFTVTFSPTSIGTKSAVVNIASNDGNENPFEIQVDGSGITPEIVVYDGMGTGGAQRTDDTGIHGFGSVNTGSSSAAQTFTIQNTGSADLTLGTVTLTGTDPGQFNVTQPVLTTLAANATTTFTVTFSPGTAGAKSAAVNIASNDVDENPFNIGLSGTGVAAPTQTSFAFTGADQTFVVPAGVTSITVKLWGGGGGAGGGSGSFVSGELAVTPNETLTIITGGGGAVSPSSGATPNAYGGGGKGIGDNGTRLGGGGGGRSAIRRSSTELVTAGAGGGGNQGTTFGGAGGLTTGGNALNGSTGAGGTQVAGGAKPVGASSATNGAQFFGGDGQAGSIPGGGGGGSGFYGGGGGADDAQYGGGGGGSSLTSNLTSFSGQAGSTGAAAGIAPGGTADLAYTVPVGRGGPTAAAGGNGLVVITYIASPTPEIAVFTGVPVITQPGDYVATGKDLPTREMASFTPADGQTYTYLEITNAANDIIGTFNDLPQGGVVAMNLNGVIYYFTANYNGGVDGNDLVLTNFVPSEPAMWKWLAGPSSRNGVGIYGNINVAAPTNNPGARQGAMNWLGQDGSLWMFGGYGYATAVTNPPRYQNDLWQYDRTLGRWIWRKGNNTPNNFGVYGAVGVEATANNPGSRHTGTTWTDANGNLWLFGGFGVGTGVGAASLNDLWRFNRATGNWTWMKGSTVTGAPAVYGTQGVAAAANTPGARSSAAGVYGNGFLWLFGGYSGTANYNDLWRYEIATGNWAWMGGSSTPNQNGVYGTQGTASTANIPGSRRDATAWAAKDGTLWFFGGLGLPATGTVAGDLSDLWSYDPVSGEWTWVKGVSTTGAAGVYGTVNTPAAGNLPGARSAGSGWVTVDGDFWLIGGFKDSMLTFNDVWIYDIESNQWTWKQGAPGTLSVPGVYGTKGEAAAGNQPGGRFTPSTWVTLNGSLWLFGGGGADAFGNTGRMSDLWSFGIENPMGVPYDNEIPADFPDSLIVNASPSASSATAGTTAYVPVSGQLTGTDVDGDRIFFSSTSATTISQGTLTLNADGTWTYTPAFGFTGIAAFQFKASDDYGGQSAVKTLVITVITNAADSDGDGIADDFERSVWGDLAAANGDGDADFDGQSNYFEFLAGTNPLSGSETLSTAPTIAGTASENGGIELQLNHVRPGVNYHLEISSNLEQWSRVGTFTFSVAGSATVQDPTPSTVTPKFYRISLEATPSVILP